MFHVTFVLVGISSVNCKWHFIEFITMRSLPVHPPLSKLHPDDVRVLTGYSSRGRTLALKKYIQILHRFIVSQSDADDCDSVLKQLELCIEIVDSVFREYNFKASIYPHHVYSSLCSALVENFPLHKNLIEELIAEKQCELEYEKLKGQVADFDQLRSKYTQFTDCGGGLPHEILRCQLVADCFVFTLETKAIVLDSSTGFRTWPAALHLASYLARTNTVLSSKPMKVYEMGCGATGFLGVALSVLGAPVASYTFTDMRADFQHLIEFNFTLDADNERFDRHKYNFVVHDWSSDLIPSEALSADLILASDPFYSPETVELFFEALGKVCAHHRNPSELIILVSNGIRQEETLELAHYTARKYGLVAEAVERRDCSELFDKTRNRLGVMQNTLHNDDLNAFRTPDDVLTILYNIKILSMQNST